MPDKFIHTEISIKELKSMAEFVKALHASGRISSEQRRLFMHAIMAGDNQGNLWTIGTQTGKWYKKAGEKWLAGQPQDRLFLVVPEKAFREAETQLAQLKLELEMKALRSNRCPHCRTELTPGARFCAKCGAVVNKTNRPEALSTQPSDKCPACGQVFEGNQRFCSKCGRTLN